MGEERLYFGVWTNEEFMDALMMGAVAMIIAFCATFVTKLAAEYFAKSQYFEEGGE